MENEVLKKKRRLITHIFLWCVATIAFFILFVISFFVVTNIFFSDTPTPPEDKDLQLAAVNIPDDQNSYFDLKHMSEVRNYPKDDVFYKKIADIYEGKEWDEKFLNDLFEKNKDAIASFDAGAKKQGFYDPAHDALTQDLNQDPPPPVINRTSAIIISLRARQLARQGNVEEAINEAFNLMHIGSALENSQTDWVYNSLGSLVMKIGVHTVREIALEGSLPRALIDSSITRLNAYRNHRTVQIMGVKLLYRNDMDSLAMMHEGLSNAEKIIGNSGFFSRIFGDLILKKSKFYFKQNQTKFLLAERARDQIVKAGEGCESIDFSVNRKLTKTDIAKGIFTNNWAGIILVNIAADTMRGLREERCRVVSEISTTQAVLAMNAYYTNKKYMPDSLNELTRGYISMVPPDAFSGVELRYDKKRDIIYSVDKDRHDDSGDKERDDVYNIKFNF